MKFFKETAEELKLVTWPTGKKLRKDVATVIQTAVLFAIFFGIVDYALNVIVTFFAK